MKLYLTLGLFSLLAYNYAYGLVDGTNASPEEFPWMVSVRALIDQPLFQACAGVIIHPKFILSTGRCCDQPSNDIYKVIN